MSPKIVIQKPVRLFDDFFQVDEYEGTYEQLNGKMSEKQRWLVFERGDSAGILLLNRDTKSVVLVEQFRLPALIGRQHDDKSITDGWMVETVAGMIEQNETPKAAIIRETFEETGYQIKDPTLIGTFFASPGGTSERIFLYFAEVQEADKRGKGGGIGNEDIKIVHMPLQALIERLENGKIDDPKLLIAAHWLCDRMKFSIDRNHLIDAYWSAGRASATAVPVASGSGPLDHSTVRYALKDKPHLKIGYKTGPIREITGIDVWVNSENTDMMMDRFLGKTVSASIRYLGANKDENDNVVEDVIEEALRAAVGRGHVKIGTVLVTGPGMLLATHQVRKIFHVATVEGVGAGLGVKASAEKLKDCLEKLLKKADKENKRYVRRFFNLKILQKYFDFGNFDSILIPLIGAGDGGLSMEEVASKVIPTAIQYLQSSEGPTLKEIYFIAFNQRGKAACDLVLEKSRAEGKLVLLGK